MKKFLIAVCSIVLAIGVSGCVGKAPVGKGKAPAPVVTRGWSNLTDRSLRLPSRTANGWEWRQAVANRLAAFLVRYWAAIQSVIIFGVFCWIGQYLPLDEGRNARAATGNPSASKSGSPAWRLLCHPWSQRFESRSHSVKSFQTPRQRHPPGYRTTINFRRKRFAGIYHHVFEPKMPPGNFLGVTHDKTPQTTTKFAGDIKVPGGTRNVGL